MFIARPISHFFVFLDESKVVVSQEFEYTKVSFIVRLKVYCPNTPILYNSNCFFALIINIALKVTQCCY
jgi:hypothetical protein